MKNKLENIKKKVVKWESLHFSLFYLNQIRLGYGLIRR